MSTFEPDIVEEWKRQTAAVRRSAIRWWVAIIVFVTAFWAGFLHVVVGFP